MNLKIALESQSIAVAPEKWLARNEAEVDAIAIAQEHFPRYFEAACEFHDWAIFVRFAATESGQVAVANSKGDESAL